MISKFPTVGQSDVSLQWPTLTKTTIANHGHHWQKWPPSEQHEALRSAPMRQMDEQEPLEQAGIFFGAVEGVYGPQNTPMLWQCIIAGTKECFEGHTHPQPPPKNTSTSLGVCHPSIWSVGMERKASCVALEGRFCRWRPWLWRLWRQLCFVLRLLKGVD
jgi:hypothetical protein